MPEKKCYYEVLNISRSADGAEVKRAYRKWALKFHPDNYDGDKAEGEKKFKELAEAYEVLSDPQKRQQYDQYGHAGLRGSGLHDFSSMGFGDIFSMFNDIFSGMGGVDSRSGGQRGLDLETEVELTLEQVATGMEQTLEFQRMDLCDACKGSGAKPGTKAEKCKTCGGHGQVQQQISGFFGMSVRVVSCPDCHGKGSIIRDKCSGCNGTGRSHKKRTLTLSIPAGIHEGQVVRVRGEGEPAKTGTVRGDLHVYARIKAHPLLSRRDNDLLCQIPVTFTTAALGGKVSIPTLKGPEDMDIPAGAQNGQVITLRKRGLPQLNTSRYGDQHVQLYIEVPKKLSKRQKELLGAYAETEKENITPNRKSFLDTLKEYFTDNEKK